MGTGAFGFTGDHLHLEVWDETVEYGLIVLAMHSGMRLVGAKGFTAKYRHCTLECLKELEVIESPAESQQSMVIKSLWG